MVLTITNREALHIAINELNELGCENTQLIEKLEKMAAAADKRAENAKSSPRSKSKDAREREARAIEVTKIIKAHGEPVTNQWLVDNVQGIPTTGKASGIMQTACNLGIVEKVGFAKVNGSPRVTYRAL